MFGLVSKQSALNEGKGGEKRHSKEEETKHVLPKHNI